MTPGRHSPAQAGFTLIEMIVVVAIIGLMVGTSVLTVRNVARSDLRSAASRAAATLRFAFDRATMTGDSIRVAFDLKKGQIWLEASEGPVALRKGKQQHHTTDADEVEEQDDGTPAGGPMLPFGPPAGAGDEGGMGLGIDGAQIKKQWEGDLRPIARPKSLFKPTKRRKLKIKAGVQIERVATPRLTDPVEDGTAYVYFFPQGHAEPAIVHFTDGADDHYSVVLHPLTGHAKVYPCLYEIPEDFGVSEDKRRGRRRKQTCGAVNP